MFLNISYINLIVGQTSRDIFRLLKVAVLDVTACLKHVFGWVLGHGKSPCFSGWGFVRLLSPDWLVLKLLCVDGVEYLE
jgi:hypothetical protein